MTATELSEQLRWPDEWPGFVAEMVEQGFDVQELLSEPWKWIEEWNRFVGPVEAAVERAGVEEVPSA